MHWPSNRNAGSRCSLELLKSRASVYGSEQVFGQALGPRGEVHRKEKHLGLVGFPNHGVQEAFLVARIGIREQDPARGQDARAGHAGVRFPQGSLERRSFQHARAGFARFLGGFIGGVVVHHDHGIRRKALDRAAHHAFFVASRDHHHAIGRCLARRNPRQQRNAQIVFAGPEEQDGRHHRENQCRRRARRQEPEGQSHPRTAKHSCFSTAAWSWARPAIAP